MTAFKNIIARPSLNFEILSKILLIFTDLLNYENDIIWNYLILGLDLMIKLIEECLIRQKSVMMTKINFEEFKIYINLNNCIIEFVEEILHKISFEKKELKDSCEKYIEIVLKYFNIIFDKNSFRPQDVFLLSSIYSLIYLIQLDKEKYVKLINMDSLKNLYHLADNTNDLNIIATKNFLREQIEFENSSLNNISFSI